LVFILRAIHLAEDVILSKASAIAGQNLVRYRLPGNLFPLGRHNLAPLALLVRKWNRNEQEMDIAGHEWGKPEWHQTKPSVLYQIPAASFKLDVDGAISLFKRITVLSITCELSVVVFKAATVVPIFRPSLALCYLYHVGRRSKTW
jgi:hypothetical protein